MLILHNILNSVWAIEPGFAANYLPMLDAYLRSDKSIPKVEIDEELKANRGKLCFATMQNGNYQVSDYGGWDAPEDAPKNSVAILNIKGVITKNDQYCGPSGMKTKADLLARCDSNDNIKAIVLTINSGGGEAYGMFEMAEAIKKCSKPVGCFIDDFSCSAAAGISTACDYVAANSTMARIGSFGTYVTIADLAERYKQMGVKLQDIYASASIDKNQEYIQAINGNPEPLRKVVNKFNDHFLALVEENRGDKLTADRKVWGTGKVWFAEEAQELGIIDEITSFENFINYFNT